MDSILHGMLVFSAIVMIIILVSSLNKQAHFISLHKCFSDCVIIVLLVVKSSKCEFLCNEVENLGHVVTATGVKNISA